MGPLSETEFGVVCDRVTNATFFVNRIIEHPIFCVVVILPGYVKRNKTIVGLEKDIHFPGGMLDELYDHYSMGVDIHFPGGTLDELYDYYSMGVDIHFHGVKLDELYDHYRMGVDIHFPGGTLDELEHVETVFQMKVCVYTLVETEGGKTVGEIVRRSLCRFPIRSKT